eukprot:CAMPEP_0176472272 /NCGR_PEP_ID=MMETSP0127-20121128/41654_1 /TAXON_ID=938130 /ORGANISM="Platyophrya macrostoma, Strain WH" /LENGTH=133 /DNA_ID=CAMNT_0017867129 /DNA_START=549 /DNA_END=947 /DNA_ORIENTATION=+
MTQKEANIYYEDWPVDFPGEYAYLIATMFMAALYAPVIPSALIWTAIGNFANYWVEKNRILRRSSIGQTLGASLAREMTELLEWFLIIYGVSTFSFNYFFLGAVSVFDIIQLVIAVANAFLPMDEINKMIFGK